MRKRERVVLISDNESFMGQNLKFIVTYSFLRWELPLLVLHLVE
jgi:hypothetical protein